MYHDYFPEVFLELAQEIQRHPDLKKIVDDHKQYGFAIILGHVAAYCEVVMDGSYTQAELIHLANKLLQKLQDKRAGNVILH